eukprot:TRINITY_DN32_c0_g6_i2.p1 TRINITY_DN32_c0_g6~~TRINITY_DN32_c0_g6_i2.p1  ORF type:complete len:405 (-),score=41.59 TRINITY_DN32_c0_g6_i2:272-1486(-)
MALEVEQDSFLVTLPRLMKDRRRMIVIVGGSIAALVIIVSIITGVALSTGDNNNKSNKMQAPSPTDNAETLEMSAPVIEKNTTRTAAQNSDDFNLKFLVVGDWGRDGSHKQDDLGVSMAQLARSFNPSFVISTGDNFYPSGLSSASDLQFKTSFQDIYSDTGLTDVPWYVVLGNHDYGDGREDEDELVDCSDTVLENCDGICCNSPIWQLGMTYKIKDNRWNCQRLFDLYLANGQVYILFIDTNPFVGKYRYEKWQYQPYGLHSQCPECQLKEIEYRLTMSDAPWKIVVGHHPVFSNGHHKNTTELVDDLEPILKSQNVQVYFNGHDHDLEHIRFENDVTNYITSGAGSKVREFDVGYRFGAKYQYPKQGYVSVEMNSETMNIVFYGIDGKLYDTTITKDGLNV